MLVIFALIATMVIAAMWFDLERPGGHEYNRRRKQYIALVCVLLGLQSALRDLSVGPDTMQYLNRYETMKLTSWDHLWNMMGNYYLEGNTGNYKDPGYEILEKVFQLTGLDYRAWLFFVAFIFFSAFGYFLYKNTQRISDACFAFILYMLIYYNFYSVTGLRQTLAMAICLWAFELAKRRRGWSFLILVLMASTIHKSALLFLPAYCLIGFKRPRLLVGASILSLPIFFLARFQITGLVGNLMGYEEYAIGFGGAGASGYALCALVAAFIVWWKTDKILSLVPQARSYISLFALSIFTIPALWVDPSIMRVTQYYSIFILVVFPLALRVLDGEVHLFACNSAWPKEPKREISEFGQGTGHIYILCMVFLVAYCLKRFWMNSYSFFFL